MSLNAVKVARRRVAAAVRTKGLRLRNEQPMVSFTFDDFPESAATVGAPILERAGAYGTFYVAGGLCGKIDHGTPMAKREQVAELAQRGHEIGCHSFSHARIPDLGHAATAGEIDRNRDFAREVVGDTMLFNFAYPFGDVSPVRKLQLQSRFASCRGINPGVNAGRIDLGLLKAVAIYDRAITRDAIRDYVNDAVAKTGWLIFYTHDVDATPSAHGTSPELLEFAIEAAKSAGCAILSVRNALGAAAFAPAA